MLFSPDRVPQQFTCVLTNERGTGKIRRVVIPAETATEAVDKIFGMLDRVGSDFGFELWLGGARITALYPDGLSGTSP